MQQFVLIAMFWLGCLASFSQEVSVDTTAIDINAPAVIDVDTAAMASYATPPFDYKQTRAWKNYKIVNTAGKITLGLGLGLAAVSGISMLAGGDEGTLLLSAGGLLLGGAVTVIGITLVSVSSIYKSKAKKMALGISPIAVPKAEGSMSYHPALSLSVTF